PSAAPATSCWLTAPMMQPACATGSPNGEQSPLSRPIPRASTHTPTTAKPIQAETSSSACFAGSKTSGASPLATTNALTSSCQPYVSPLQSLGGQIESQP